MKKDLLPRGVINSHKESVVSRSTYDGAVKAHEAAEQRVSYLENVLLSIHGWHDNTDEKIAEAFAKNGKVPSYEMLEAMFEGRRVSKT